MRGSKRSYGPTLLPTGYHISDYVPQNHPLRAIRKLVDAELERMSPLFAKAYCQRGRPSIPPEHLIKASLLQAFYGIPSERQLCEQIHYNMLFRWFIGLEPDSKVWDHSTFTRNRERFSQHGLMQKFFNGSVAKAIQSQAIDGEEFSVDGSLIQSWASMKSVRPKDEDDQDYDSGAWADFKGEKRSNATHQSKTDPDARLYKKGRGKEALLCHSAHILIDNAHGLIVDIGMSEANGKAEREMALEMMKRTRQRHWLKPERLGADKGYDAASFMEALEAEDIEPHIALKKTTISHPARERAAERSSSLVGYWMARSRRCAESVFGWLKERAGLKRMRRKSRRYEKDYAFVSGAAYNFLRLSKLLAA